jgi:hypothetical protein
MKKRRMLTNEEGDILAWVLRFGQLYVGDDTQRWTLR